MRPPAPTSGRFCARLQRVCPKSIKAGREAPERGAASAPNDHLSEGTVPPRSDLTQNYWQRIVLGPHTGFHLADQRVGKFRGGGSAADVASKRASLAIEFMQRGVDPSRGCGLADVVEHHDAAHQQR